MTERITKVHKWETVEQFDEDTGRTLIGRAPVEWTDEYVTESAKVTMYEPMPGICAECGERVGDLYWPFWGPNELMCAKCARSYGPNGKVVNTGQEE